jgi:hypothetical protein
VPALGAPVEISPHAYRRRMPQDFRDSQAGSQKLVRGVDRPLDAVAGMAVHGGRQAVVVGRLDRGAQLAPRSLPPAVYHSGNRVSSSS